MNIRNITCIILLLAAAMLDRCSEPAAKLGASNRHASRAHRRIENQVAFEGISEKEIFAKGQGFLGRMKMMMLLVRREEYHRRGEAP